MNSAKSDGAPFNLQGRRQLGPQSRRVPSLRRHEKARVCAPDLASSNQKQNTASQLVSESDVLKPRNALRRGLRTVLVRLHVCLTVSARGTALVAARRQNI